MKKNTIITLLIITILIASYIGMTYRAMECLNYPKFNIFSKIPVAIYSTKEFNDSESNLIKKAGAKIIPNSWVNPAGTNPYGFYRAEVRVYNICKVKNQNFIEKIKYLGTESYAI